MGDKITAGRDAFKADRHSVIYGSTNSAAADAAQRFGGLTAEAQEAVVQAAMKEGGATKTFVLNLSLGTPVDAPLEIVNKVLGIIENVSSRFRR